MRRWSNLSEEVAELFSSAQEAPAPSAARPPPGKWSRVTMAPPALKLPRRRAGPPRVRMETAPKVDAKGRPLCTGGCGKVRRPSRGPKCRDCMFRDGEANSRSRGSVHKAKKGKHSGRACPGGCGRILRSSSKERCRDCRRAAGEKRRGAPVVELRPDGFDVRALTDEQLVACIREARRRQQALADALGGTAALAVAREVA
jgi:hypothetical protein